MHKTRQQLKHEHNQQAIEHTRKRIQREERLYTKQVTQTNAGNIWEELHDIADAHRRFMRREFLKALRDLDEQAQGRISFIRRQIDAGDEASIQRAIDAVPWSRLEENVQEIRGPFNSIFQDVGEDVAPLWTEAVREIRGRLRADEAEILLAFDETNPRAIEYLDSRLAKLGQNFSSQGQRGVLQVIRRGFKEQLTRRQMSAELARKGFFGMNRHQMMNQLKMKMRLTKQVQAGDMSQRAANNILDNAVERRVRNRAEMIARTETIRTSNAGQQAIWETAEKEGFIDSDRTSRIWIATADDRTCPICLDLDGQRVGLHDNFSSSPSTGFGVTEQIPPAHPRCRCALGLVTTPHRQRSPKVFA